VHNRFKEWLRARFRRFLGLDSTDLVLESVRQQVEQLGPLKERLDRLEQIVYALEESHYRSIGKPMPARNTIFVGGMDDFREIGQEFLGHFKTICGLKPNERVLDVGCGIGRMALPLTRYLDEQGSYEGFDIVPEGIDWCVKNISSRYPNFHFQVAEMFNKLYNPTGKFLAREYCFPYENEAFDFVFMTSVFTHILPEDMENYMRETARVLKRGGRCLITYFLWNSEAEQLTKAGKSKFDFKHDVGNYRLVDVNTPEWAVCHDESHVLSLYDKYGLSARIYYGAWCGRTDFLNGQDIIVASKG
jgi:ubiquinone/menaquinone biosynthesis C-methylase UbiE